MVRAHHGPPSFESEKFKSILAIRILVLAKLFEQVREKLA
jgi:hypothetical protein